MRDKKFRAAGPSMVLLILAAGHGVGRAEGASAPHFTTLERFDETSRLTLEYGRFFIDSGGVGDGTSMSASRIALGGQYVDGELGLYGAVFLNEMTFEYDGTSSSHSGVSNLELGAFWQGKAGPARAIARGGLMLPSAQDGMSALANALTSYQQLPDFVRAAPHRWGPRGSVSVYRTEGLVHFRGDFGFDLLIPTDEAREYGADPDTELWAHLDFGLGIAPGPVSIGLEWANVAKIVSDDDRDFDRRHFTSAALRLAWLGEFVQPSLSLVAPLDEEPRGEVFVVVLGVDLLGVP